MPSNLAGQKQVQKTYSDDFMFVIEKEFFTWMLRIPETFLDPAGRKRSALVVPAVFVVCHLLTIAVTFLKTSPRRFNGVRSHEKTTYHLYK